MPRILLIGSTGLLGSSFKRVLDTNSDFETFAPLRSEFDLDSEKSLLGFFDQNANFDYVINCSGYNFVDKAEENKEEEENCYYLNATVPKILASICNDIKIPFLQFSSDYVFDGKNSDGYNEDAVKNPLSVYGHSKNLGEENVLNANNLAAVVRLSWLYGPDRPNFVKNILDAYRNNGIVKIVTDQVGKASYAMDIADSCIKNLDLISKGGIFHLSNEQVFSWYEFAEIALKFYFEQPNITPIDSIELNRLAKRPKYSILLNNKLPKLRSTNLAIKDYLNSFYL